MSKNLILFHSFYQVEPITLGMRTYELHLYYIPYKHYNIHYIQYKQSILHITMTFQKIMIYWKYRNDYVFKKVNTN